MSAPAPAKPESNEYASYYEKYVSLVPEGGVVETLERQGAETLALLRGLTEEQGARRYEEGKWSVKQVFGHVVDTERIFAYRALAIARGEQQPLPGMDQEDYMAGVDFDARTLASLADEFEAVRRSTVLLLRSLTPEAWARRGTASGYEVTVRALAYILAGHEAHHVRILRERYL
ncbi:MAG TPA: DinB family protein [Pyrinomonadaceae bacterium]|nr:DinB family protein [Pyrinomonadaceae bacterium]